MIDVAVVSFAQRQEASIPGESEVEFMVPLMEQAKAAVGLTQADMGFTCSGSSDFLAGQAFSFVMTIDGTGPVPPISESHVEQDGAWALYEAWVKIQCGGIDTAFVYSYGKSSPGSLRDVLATQMDPYYVCPLWPDSPRRGGSGGPPACLREGMSASAAWPRSRPAAGPAPPPTPTRCGPSPSPWTEILAEEYALDPLRPSDLPAEADGGCAVVLAAGDRARELCERPAWIRGIDHRSDAHTLGVRDLTSSMSARLAAQHRAGAGADKIDYGRAARALHHLRALLVRGPRHRRGLVPRSTRRGARSPRTR